ncbi:MAG: PqqD family protein [Clostridia bacterium]|nr:PqqD family protein [Clostridia bacterium]
MKIKDGYMQSTVAGRAVVVPLGHSNTFRNMIKLNETGKFLWTFLTEETTRDALVDALAAEYEIDRTIAERDVDAFLATLREFGVLAE